MVSNSSLTDCHVAGTLSTSAVSTTLEDVGAMEDMLTDTADVLEGDVEDIECDDTMVGDGGKPLGNLLGNPLVYAVPLAPSRLACLLCDHTTAPLLCTGKNSFINL